MRNCFICGESDPKVPLIEADHIFGRKYSDLTILLCLNCHAKKTFYQNKLPMNVRKSCKNESIGIFALASIGALLVIIGKELVKIALELSNEKRLKK